jgi:hypothetical protein
VPSNDDAVIQLRDTQKLDNLLDAPDTTIVSAEDLWIRIKFFVGVVASVAIDLVLLTILLFLLVGGHWLFDRLKDNYPNQVVIVGWGELIGLGAVGICILFFIVLDVRRVLMRTWRVMSVVTTKTLRSRKDER